MKMYNWFDTLKILGAILFLPCLILGFVIYYQTIPQKTSETFREDGHQYKTFFRAGETHIIHDPSCPCNNKK